MTTTELPPNFNPPALPDTIADAFRANRPRRVDDGDGATIPEGGRDVYLTSLAGTMRRRGMTREEIQAALLATNANRCDPPLDERDVQRIAWSVAQYPHTDEVLERIAAAEVQLDHGGASEPDSVIWERAGFGWLNVREALEADPPAYDWLWRGMIERREVIWFSGAGKTGKSMLALFLGCALLAGQDRFLGLELGDLEWLVYLDAENPEKTVRRRLHLAGIPVDLADRIRYGIVRGADLSTPQGLEALDRAVRDRPGALLVLDSLIGLHTADEDKAGEVRRFVSGIRSVAEAHDLTVIGLVHENHQGRTRGSTDWLNSSDGTLRVSIESEGGVSKREWRKVEPVNRRDGDDNDGSLNTSPLYQFQVFHDATMGRRRLAMVTPTGDKTTVVEAEVASREEDQTEQFITAICRIVGADPTVSLRGLASALNVNPGHRAFRRALETAANRSGAVHNWRENHKRGSN